MDSGALSVASGKITMPIYRFMVSSGNPKTMLHTRVDRKAPPPPFMRRHKVFQPVHKTHLQTIRSGLCFAFLPSLLTMDQSAGKMFDPRSFLNYVKNIGRAYQRQAQELVNISRLFLEASPQTEHYDVAFRQAMAAVDKALRCAADAKKSVSSEAAGAFKAAEVVLAQYQARAFPKYELAEIAERMSSAKKRDEYSSDWFSRFLGFFTGQKIDKRADTPFKPTLTINFMLLRSDPSQEPLKVPR
ncbi:hypothetical protein BC834DRAFT_875401, partial [Gloeopeniophorella convolvens]